jgi:peptidoglycan/LPS O-acetylase OafA/YrhL
LVFGYHLHTSTAVRQFGHAGFLFKQGAVGVSFFFVLSGFVLMWSRKGPERPATFLRNRVARIYPAYAVTWVAATVLVVAVDHAHPTLGQFLAGLVLLQAWFPSTHVAFAINPVAWSLSCEAFFYGVFAFIAPRVGGIRPSQRRAAMAVLIGATFVIAAACYPAREGTLQFWLVYLAPPVRIIEFAVGMLLASELQASRGARVPRVGAVALAAGAYLLAGALPLAANDLRVVVPIIPSVVLIYAFARADLDGARPPAPALVRLGAWSYAFYLVQVRAIALVVDAATKLTGTSPGTLSSPVALACALLALAATTAGAAALYTWIERPGERRLRARRVPDNT